MAEPRTAEDMMTPLDVFELYCVALNRADLTAMAALLHDDFRLEGAGLDGIDKPKFLGAMKAQFDAFEGYSENPSGVSEQGDVVRFTAHVTGRHTGTLALPGMAPIPATGRSIALPPEPCWVKIGDGKLSVYHVEAVAGGGIDGILQQIGGGR
jgi:hypothetical protein